MMSISTDTPGAGVGVKRYMGSFLTLSEWWEFRASERQSCMCVMQLCVSQVTPTCHWRAISRRRRKMNQIYMMYDVCDANLNQAAASRQACDVGVY